jgi:hypothetical protein
MRMALRLLSICILICATGCALVPQRYQLAAAPLIDLPPACVVPPVPRGVVPLSTSAACVPIQPIDQVNLLVQDSQQKCAEFVNSMFAETAGSGFVLDVLATGTSAVSSIVTPLSTAHALSAATSVLSGTKTGISANYLNTLSISHITQAIQSTYTTDIKNYVNSLASLTEDQQKLLNPFMERSKIESYHAECSLAAAEGSINTTLQATGQLGQAIPSLTYTVKGTGDITASGLTTQLEIAINNFSAFQQAGITALPSSDTAIALVMKNALNFSIKASNTNFSAAVVQGTPAKPAQITISVTRALAKGDTVTITATAPSGTPATGAQQPGGAGQTAPAAASAQPTTSH